MGEHGKHRPLVGPGAGRAVALAAVLAAAPPAAGTAAECRQALSLGLDVSGSVDHGEYALQLGGLARALMAPAVQDAFLAVPGAPVRLHVYIWAGAAGPRDLLPWTEIADAGALEQAAARLTGSLRHRLGAETALGAAMAYGGRALQSQRDCWRLSLDISGDGRSNAGPAPARVRMAGIMAGITINGLVVGEDITGADRPPGAEAALLADYYRSQVIAGPQAFVERIDDFADFERAMIRKLLKELQTPSLGGLAPAARPVAAQ